MVNTTMILIYKIYEILLAKKLQRNVIPKHVAFIPDSKCRSYADSSLYKVYDTAVKKLFEVVDWCFKLGIDIVSVFVLPLRDLQRPVDELEVLYKVMRKYVNRLYREALERNFRVNILSLSEALPRDIREFLIKIEKETHGNKHLLNLAIAYDGRAEIVKAAQAITKDILTGKLSFHHLNEKVFEGYLLLRDIPYPDLVIKTGGTTHIDGFLLWYVAYSELFFTNTRWLNFSKVDLLKALLNYQKRQRRYGA